MSERWGSTNDPQFNDAWSGHNGATCAWWIVDSEDSSASLYIATYKGDPKYWIQTSDFSERVNVGIGMDTLEEAQAIYLLLERS